MNHLSSKTKLIATFGPSLDKLMGIDIKNIKSINKSESYDAYNKLVDSGLDVFRFNMSHDTIENHKIRFNL